MSQDPLDLARDIVTRWSVCVSHLNDPGCNGEELDEFIDIVDSPRDGFDDAEDGIRSSLILIPARASTLPTTASSWRT